MKNKFFNFLIFSICLLTLSSCGIIDFIDSYNSFIHGDESYEGNDSSSFERGEIGDSINILNEVFNGTTNKFDQNLRKDFSNIKSNDNFNNAERLNINQNIQSLEYFNGALPSKGKVDCLVIPIDFPDYPAKTNFSLDSIKVNYQSVSSYYYNSSYGQLDLNFDILDWHRMSKKASYYEKYNEGKHAGDVPGVSAIIKEVFTSLDDEIDFSKYDSDKDGAIDSVYFIYSHPFNSINSNFWWAFQYFYFEQDLFDGVIPYYYIFASYDFIFQNDKKVVSAETYIHETGHLFGLEDYYDYDTYNGYNKGGLGGADMMDCNFGDHNPFSKLSLGWIDDPILVNKSGTISISPFEENGDVIMICDNYDSSKGMFQDYFLVTYFKYRSLLNLNSDFYSSNGIKIYRVHATLEKYNTDGQTFNYFKYDNSYTDFNLIDNIIASARTKSTATNNGIYSNLIYDDMCAATNDLFLSGYVANNLCYYDYRFSNNNKYSSFEFTVDSLTDDKATLTFKKN